MRPHRLRLTAFGPFAGTVDVDLDALAEGGLFLLHGETGAGKSTLLDGIGFALFGRVPGARAEAKRLRSDHAAAATRSEVQLEATLAGRRMRVTRSPEQERAKLRGTGTTIEPAKVLLEEHDGERWTTVSTRVGEADRELADLVGMSAEQFFQVVLLPQGEFARFLRARSDERTALLERLFGTDRFRAVEQWLVDRRRSSAAARDTARDGVARLAARVAQVAGTPQPDELPEPGWADALAAGAGAAHTDAERERLRSQAALDQALAADEQARQLADRQRRRRAALAEQERLVAEQPELALLEQQAEAARCSAEVAAALDDAAARDAQLTAAIGSRAVADTALPPPLRSADAEQLRATRAAAAERVGRLDALQADADRAAAETRAAEAAGRVAAQADHESARLRTAQQDLPVQRAAAEADRAQAQAALARLPALRAELERQRSLAADAEVLEVAHLELAALRAGHLTAREAAVTAAEVATALRVARVDGMVAELAATLVDGAPCFVCGSTDHPDPAEVQGERVSREAEDAARVEADQLRDVAELAGARVAAVEATAAALAERTGGVHAAAVAARLETLTAEHSALDAAAAALPAAEAALQQCDELAATLSARLAGLAAEQAGALAEQEAAVARAAVALAVVAAELDGAPDLSGARSRVRAELAALDAAIASRERCAVAEAEAARAAAVADAAVRAAGFPDVAAATAARRDPAWRAQAAARCRTHRESLAAVQALLAEPDLDVALEPTADVAAAAAAVETERARHSAAAALAGQRGERARQLAALVPQLDAALAQLAPLTARAAEVRALADLATGTGANTLRMTLSAYVLAARLEEVAAVASERLLRMTQGRYSLVHTDAGRGAGRAGLGLLARDTWTGHDRDTSTLSGGETFLASLALALGLADVVAAEAGGARTEALFVDEGFGTLDEQALEEVMDVLDGLREGGRLVGVVSHVPELRHRIPTQVHVRKSRTGSDVALVGC